MKTGYLSCLLLSLFAFTAQAQRNPVPAIGITDTAKVYPAASYEALTAERLEEQSCLPLEGKEREVLNALFQGTKWYNDCSYIAPAKGVFIEVSAVGGRKYGYYVGEKKYEWVKVDDAFKRAYSIPKKMRPQIDAIITRYHQQLSDKDTVVARYDHLPLNSLAIFYRRTLVSVCFYVRTASREVTPILYFIHRDKQQKVTGWRTVSMWERYIFHHQDGDGLLYVVNPETGKPIPVNGMGESPEALAALEQMIPGWKEMGDAERMRVLDGKIEWH